MDDVQESKKLLSALRSMVSRAWQTMAQARDPDGRFLGMAGSWPFAVVHDFNEAYGYSSAKVRRFTPTAKDVSDAELVMTWMAWLRREEGDDAIRRIMAWSLGVPTWMLGQRERCSERTILNRIDRSLARVLAQFMAADPEIETVEELDSAKPTIVGTAPEPRALELPPGMSVVAISGIEPGKVFITGLGYMFRGKPWNDGSWKTKKYA